MDNEPAQHENRSSTPFVEDKFELSRRRFGANLTVLALTVLGCSQEKVTVDLGVPSLAAFPNVSAALLRLQEEASYRNEPPSVLERQRHVELLTAAIRTDLKSNNFLPQPDASNKDIFAAFDRHLFEKHGQLFMRLDELMIYQIISLEHTGTVPRGSYDFGRFGDLKTDVEVYSTGKILYSTRAYELPFRGTNLSVDNINLVVLNEAEFRADPARGITRYDNRKRTLDNEVGHIHFAAYIKSDSPKLVDDMSHQVLCVNEAFSFYSNLSHTPRLELLSYTVEYIQGLLDGNLPQQYSASSAYLVSGLNSFLGIREKAPDVWEVFPERYAELFNEAQLRPERLEALTRHLTSHFEAEMLKDLELISMGQCRQFFNPR